ncbi:crotonase/enoyl-CoA hydratase family protein [Derxia lacustris]|uniref:crotonase/enoyl-CoA hydratase family protein n=1 Tax=Derxia lacustris TaxID=764842 RepID=UPI000A173637|nr:crotonase/enoyl-CoA hydratase family protein [Derxia lacustris]
MNSVVRELPRLNSPVAPAQYETEFDPEFGVFWGYFANSGNACFTLELLHDIRRADARFQASHGQIEIDGQRRRANYYVAASRQPGVFNTGGDLALFTQLIAERDREGLHDYARLCIDNLYARSQRYFCEGLITISLVQGDALGGGFETALSSDIIIAEEQSKFGLPEILFNLFPGMGAYSFLARRVGRRTAERLILSGEILSARELHELGIVDAVVPEGTGRAGTMDWIRRQHRRRNGMQAVFQARDEIQPVTHDELMRVTGIWVDAALRLDDKDLRTMQRLVRAQTRRFQPETAARLPQRPMPATASRATGTQPADQPAGCA